MPAQPSTISTSAPDSTSSVSAPDSPTPLPLSAPDRIDQFEHLILSHKQIFALGGSIPVGEIDPAGLAMFYSADMVDLNVLRFPPSDQDLSKFYDTASPSPFGKNEEKVYDGTYRQAKELKPPHFALSHDLISNSTIIPILSANLFLSGHVHASLNKVNAYATGGFFKEHRDTPLGKGHIGTITFCLPMAFTGGKLVVSQDGTETGSGLITWAFLYSDVCQESRPVTSGTRITVAYDVWHVPKHTPLSSTDLSTIANPPIKEYLVSLLGDSRHFMPQGGRIAFGTRHAYPVDRKDKDLRHLLNSFKGKDAVLMAALRELGLKVQIKAVYNVDDYYLKEMEEVEARKKPKVEDQSVPEPEDPSTVNARTVGERYRLLTGRSFWVVEDEYYETDMACELVDCKRASYEKDVIWITKPGAYGHKNAYIACGNEPTADTLYIGIAVFVTIPPGNEREAARVF